MGGPPIKDRSISFLREMQDMYRNEIDIAMCHLENLVAESNAIELEIIGILANVDPDEDG